MFVEALYDTPSLVVLALVLAMVALSGYWAYRAQQHLAVIQGGLGVLRNIGRELAADHPIRKRLESAPVVELSLEELAQLLRGEPVEPAAASLVALKRRLRWVERFAQLSIHLGIMGTVLALVSADPTDIEAFRASLPRALGTTFWGLIGAMGLSTLGGYSEGIEDRASVAVRQALLKSFEAPSPDPDPEQDEQQPAG